ncbi:MAG: hypothetical protein JF571_09150, partial [Asticcacaulis sp.]|nr:hypothetical protein [Asticcacaulis sp.]
MPGIDAVLKSPAHVIWFGELHGTTETPAFFGDAVCAAAKDGRKVIVALERSKMDDGVLAAFLDTPEHDTATSILLTGREWRNRGQDGRSSLAMLSLMGRLRDDKASGVIADIVLIDDWRDTEGSDAAMAKTVKAALTKSPDARLLVYSGNFHAMKTAPQGTHTAASQLPADDVYAVNIQIEGGTAWSLEKGVVAVPGFPHRAAGIFRAADTGLP